MSNLHSMHHSPLILAVDTSFAVASLAIARGSQVIASITGDDSTPHSKIFFNLLSSLLRDASLRLADIDAFAAATGPGSFTGLRVGLSAVKGLAHTSGKPVVGVSSIDALALASGKIGKVLGVIAAGREEVYAGLRDIGIDGSLRILGEDTVGKPSDAINSFAQHINKEELWAELIVEPGTAIPSLADAIAIRASNILRDNGCFDLKPYYIRPSDAELKKTPEGSGA